MQRALLALLVCASGKLASAQGLDAERFVPAVGAEGGFVNEHPAVPYHLGWSLGLFLNFADDQVVERNQMDDVIGKPVDTALTADLVAAIGLAGIGELGMHLPVHAIYDGDRYGGLAAAAGVGDLRFVPKLAIVRSGNLEQHFLLGVALPVSLPTGDDEALRGAGGVTVGAKLLFAAHIGKLGLGFDAGYRWRSEHPPLPFGDSVQLGPWVAYSLSDALVLRAEMFSEKHVSTERDGADFPVEVLGGVEYRTVGGLGLYGGASLGATDGIGDPDFRLIGGVRFRDTAGPGDSGGHPERQGFGDSDGDGVLDKDDAAPHDPEDMDGYGDGDGAPEADNDGDGILDGDDECPDFAGEADRNGCPSRTLVRIENGEMVIIGKVQFETGSARITKKSNPLLDQIAQALQEHPQITKIRIEGHTDDVGDDAVNQKLSEQRAGAVKEALVKRGVAEGRLDIRGMGETKPLAPNSSPGGRQKNRRVEFVIVEGK